MNVMYNDKEYCVVMCDELYLCSATQTGTIYARTLKCTHRLKNENFQHHQIA